jgi:hypothetical protein
MTKYITYKEKIVNSTESLEMSVFFAIHALVVLVDKLTDTRPQAD